MTQAHPRGGAFSASHGQPAQPGTAPAPYTRDELDGIDDTCSVGNRWNFDRSEYGTVVAVGDVHGDYAAFQACMLMTSCVFVDGKGHLHWSEGRANVAVVLIGDLVDRWRPGKDRDGGMLFEGAGPPDGGRGAGEFGNDEHMVLQAASVLATQAARCGSAVFRLLGNHEMDQAFMCWENESYWPGWKKNTMKYVSPWEQRRSSVSDNTPESRASSFFDGQYNRELLDCGARAIVKIGEYMFVHGGVNPSVVRTADSLRSPLPELCNRLARCVLDRGGSDASRAFVQSLGSRDCKELCKQMLTKPSFSVGRVNPLSLERRMKQPADGGVLWDDRLSNDDAFDSHPAYGEYAGTALARDTKDEQTRAMEAYVTRLLRDLNRNLLTGDASMQPVQKLVVAHCVQGELKHTSMRPHGAYLRQEHSSRAWTSYIAADPLSGQAASHGVALLHGRRVWCVDVGQSRSTHREEQRDNRPTVLVLNLMNGEEEVRRWNLHLGQIACIRAGDM